MNKNNNNKNNQKTLKNKKKNNKLFTKLKNNKPQLVYKNRQISKNHPLLNREYDAFPSIEEAYHPHGNVILKGSGRNRIEQPSSSKSLLSNLDTMDLAKLTPGAFPAPYCSNLNTIPVSNMTYVTNQTLSKVTSVTGGGFAVEAMGTKTYQVIFFMPTVSQTSRSSTVNIGKCSGFSWTQTGSEDEAYNASFFTTGSYPLDFLLGSDPSDFSTTAMNWASDVRIALTIPQANIAGIVWTGQTQYRQWFDREGNQIKLTVKDLIEIAGEGEAMADKPKQVIMSKAAVVNHDLLLDYPVRPPGSTSPALMEPYSAEMVNFVIIQSAAKNITTGTDMTFTAGINWHGNLAFFPRADNALMNNLFRGYQFEGRLVDKQSHLHQHIKDISHLDEVKPTKDLVKAVQDIMEHSNPDGSIKEHALNGVGKTIWKGVKSLPGLVQKYGPLAAKIASLLLSPVGKTDGGCCQIMTKNGCRHKIRSIQFTISNWPCRPDSLVKWVNSAYQKLSSYPEEWIYGELPSPFEDLENKLGQLELLIQESKESQELISENSFEENPTPSTVLKVEQWSKLDLTSFKDREDIDDKTFRVGPFVCQKPKLSLPGGSSNKNNLLLEEILEEIRSEIPEPIAKGIGLFRAEHGDLETQLIRYAKNGGKAYMAGPYLESNDLKDLLTRGLGRVPLLSERKDLYYYTGSVNNISQLCEQIESGVIIGFGFHIWSSEAEDITVIAFWPEVEYYSKGHMTCFRYLTCDTKQIRQIDDVICTISDYWYECGTQAPTTDLDQWDEPQWEEAPEDTTHVIQG